MEEKMRVLFADIDGEWGELRRIHGAVTLKAGTLRKDTENEDMLVSLAYYLHNCYSACETIFKQIAGDVESISRLYYAMFNAVQALLITRSLSFSSHRGVISAFNKHFVKEGIFPPELKGPVRSSAISRISASGRVSRTPLPVSGITGKIFKKTLHFRELYSSLIGLARNLSDIWAPYAVLRCLDSRFCIGTIKL